MVKAADAKEGKKRKESWCVSENVRMHSCVEVPAMDALNFHLSRGAEV